MSDSEKYVFLTLRRSSLETLLDLLPRQIFVSGVRRVTLQARLFASRRWTAWLRAVSNTTHVIFLVGRGAVRLCVALLKAEQESTISKPNQYLSSEVNVIARETDWQPTLNLLIRCISTFIVMLSCIKAWENDWSATHSLYCSIICLLMQPNLLLWLQ